MSITIPFCLSLGRRLGYLKSIDCSSVLKLTQPDLVLWYPKADSD